MPQRRRGDRLGGVSSLARRSALGLAVSLLLLLTLASIQIARDVPVIEVTTSLPAATMLGDPASLRLPESGATIIAVEGLGSLASSGPETPRPIASVTKMMTALVILQEHPLQPGETGPILTLTRADVERTFQMIAEDQSVLLFEAGLELTQYQLLQGLLIPSANNFAEILAVWDAGSVAAFVEKMNEAARALGMTSTTYADASGLSPDSVSTPADQLLLAAVAMENPVFREIVALPEIVLPDIGRVYNVNALLGERGVIGIKTGYTEEAGANLAFAAQRQVESRLVDVTGVVLGQPNRLLTFDAVRTILATLDNGLHTVRAVTAGQPVATIEVAWSDDIAVVAAENVDLLLWPGMTLETSVEIEKIEAPLAAGSQVGWLDVRLGEQRQRIALKLAAAIPGIPLLWRLARL